MPYENGRRVPSPEVLERIRGALAVRPSARVEQHRDSIRALVAKHHAAAPRVFGSVARGDDQPGSDVDILVDFTEEASLLDEVGLRLALIDLLRVDVDVVAADISPRPHARAGPRRGGGGVTESRQKGLEAAERVIAVCDVLADTLPPDVDAFVADVRTQWAVEMGLIRIGEAVNRIPGEVLELFPEQPWRQIVSMRNFAAHQYDDLDPRRVGAPSRATSTPCAPTSSTRWSPG